VARRADESRPAVWRWQVRYAEQRMDGLLRDKTRKPGKARLSPETIAKVLAPTCSEPPGEATHWTGRAIAKVVGIGLSSVQRLWEAHRLQPHRIRTFKTTKIPPSPRSSSSRWIFSALRFDCRLSGLCAFGIAITPSWSSSHAIATWAAEKPCLPPMRFIDGSVRTLFESSPHGRNVDNNLQSDGQSVLESPEVHDWHIEATAGRPDTAVSSADNRNAVTAIDNAFDCHAVL
jgi:hypothetical protein